MAGDALHLPFADATFDAVTISFGLRNVEDPGAALREFARVTRPGGQLLVCEFSRPRPAPIRWGYRWYLRNVLPLLARRVSSNPEAYTYLQETIDAWPDQPSLARMIARSGWTDVRVAEHDVRRGRAAPRRPPRRPDRGTARAGRTDRRRTVARRPPLVRAACDESYTVWRTAS